MKMDEIRNLDDADLKLKEENLRKELFDLRCKAATESIENPSRIGEIKRGIARILTEQRRREMARSTQS